MPDIFVSLSGEATGEDSGKESCLHRWNRSPRTIRTRVFRVSRVLVIRILSSSAGERMSTLWMSLPSTVRQSPTAKCVGRGSDDLGRTTKALGCFSARSLFRQERSEACLSVSGSAEYHLLSVVPGQEESGWSGILSISGDGRRVRRSLFRTGLPDGDFLRPVLRRSKGLQTVLSMPEKKPAQNGKMVGQHLCEKSSCTRIVSNAWRSLLLGRIVSDMRRIGSDDTLLLLPGTIGQVASVAQRSRTFFPKRSFLPNLRRMPASDPVFLCVVFDSPPGR